MAVLFALASLMSHARNTPGEPERTIGQAGTTLTHSPPPEGGGTSGPRMSGSKPDVATRRSPEPTDVEIAPDPGSPEVTPRATASTGPGEPADPEIELPAARPG